MFTSVQCLKRKSSSSAVKRQEFIEHLVDEYYTTTDLEAQEQVSANLANFAYDPGNWEYLKTADAVKLFLELLESPNETLKLHGIAGLCNICLDQETSAYMREHFRIIQQCLLISQNDEVLLNCLTLFYQVLSNDEGNRSLLTAENVLENDMNLWKNIQSRAIMMKKELRLCSNKPTFPDRTQLKFTKKFLQEDLDKFSQLTGDFNTLHSDKIPLKNRIVHGAFLNAVIAGLIGTYFPGPGTIVLEQKLKFPNPCRINIDCEFLICLEQDRKISTVSYECKQSDCIVFNGEAKLLIYNKNTN